MLNYEKDDYIVRASAKNGLIRGFAIRSTEIVSTAKKYHDLCPTSTIALGQLLTATALLSHDLKTDDASLTLNLRGDGALHTLLAIGQRDGTVRGYADPAAIETQYTTDQKIDVASAIGNGTLIVSRHDGIERQAYSSQTELLNGDITGSIASYLYYSAQIPSFVTLGVKLNADGVQAAGGMLVQLMPGWHDELADWLEMRAGGFPNVTYWFEEGMNPHQLLDLLLGDPEIDYAAAMPARYHCTCTAERMLDNLFALPASDLDELIADPNGVGIDCHFCNKHYQFSHEDLRQVRAMRQH